MKTKGLPLVTLEHKRDAYGFTVRPQHLQRYREYANIYKEEEEERSERWKDFLETHTHSSHNLVNESSPKDDSRVPNQVVEQESGSAQVEEDESSVNFAKNVDEREAVTKEIRTHKAQIWTDIRPSLGAIEHMLSFRVKKRKSLSRSGTDVGIGNHLPTIEETRPSKPSKAYAGVSEEDSDDEFYDVERSDPVQDAPSSDIINSDLAAESGGNGPQLEPISHWREELECLVRGGVPMALRGELWQAFVGVRVRRIEGYYGQLLAPEGIEGEETDSGNSQSDNSTKASTQLHAKPPEKWKGQIEKDLPRTFPGHPALDEDGRNALRRLLTAYARHNPSVGYCQAMNFFAGLLLLLMPEENAFWTLVGIIDDYFDGYYSEEMIESQVDQLVYEELVRERFPKLVSHLDYLGVQVAWVTGPWFLSIFVNMLPWESVLRVWDVLLFDGNRVMLFRTALAIMELYGPALVTTKDAGDAVTLLQSLAGSTFDSSQLVLTACMGYQAVTEEKLRDLLIKHRPEVMAAIDERSKELGNWRVSQGLATKLYSFKRDPGSLRAESAPKEGLGDMHINGDMCLVDSATRDLDELINGLNGDDSSSVPDLQEQVVWLKVELCKLLEEKRSAILRAEELETALMEMVKQDNRRLLSAKVEQLEQEVAELRQALADKQEQEHAMIQVLMRVEQEQRVTEDARRFAEQDAAAQRYAANVLQEKYEEAMASLAQMEKRVVMAESMLEATLQYQSSQVKAQIPSPSPRSASQETTPLRTSHETMQEIPARKPGLLSRPFGLGWRERNKGKPSNTEEPGDAKTHDEEHLNPAVLEKDINGH
ncbi:hypothetical protein AMTRI_Chr08g165430 [Amborella trichopoda]|uniref:Rab-GAP TBC domain-containing protein n=1 Tax=Amborella trichopoda TaxID=13333 RepID=W1NJL6_AMBTC|nr:EVI5-like protein isoform X1 [Amborella trichopoda]ERM95683.1 hypothetical protein AMTR_s00023p00210990 [Amborella trichopoda]|eukprot:XP_006828267.1 EVI5-like protein isoform X1 [Amborella trichopoda]